MALNQLVLKAIIVMVVILNFFFILSLSKYHSGLDPLIPGLTRNLYSY